MSRHPYVDTYHVLGSYCRRCGTSKKAGECLRQFDVTDPIVREWAVGRGMAIDGSVAICGGTEVIQLHGLGTMVMRSTHESDDWKR